MSKRKPVLPHIREMQRRVEETFAGLINRAEVESEIAAAEAVIRAARVKLTDLPKFSDGEYLTGRDAAMGRALARLDRVSRGSK